MSRQKIDRKKLHCIYSKDNVSDSIVHVGETGLFSHSDDFEKSAQGKLTRIVICEDEVFYECNYADKKFCYFKYLKICDEVKK